MPPTGNTLTPTYNSVEQAPPKDMFVKPVEPAQPELTAKITQEDLKPHFVEPDLNRLADQARDVAVASWSISPTAVPQQERVAAPPVIEKGIDTDEELAYQEVANDGPAVVGIRRGELSLRDLTPEQRQQAHMN